MIRVELDDQTPGRLLIEAADYEINLVKQIPGVSYKQRRITIPLSWASYLTARGVLEEDFEAGPKFQEWIRAEYDNRVAPSRMLRGLTDIDPEGFDPRLRSFQRAGVAWLALNQQALLADDMGTGKTVQTIMALKRLEDYGHDVFPALIIAPKSVKHQWRETFDGWFDSPIVEMVNGSATERRKALQAQSDVFIVNWDVMRLHSRLAPYGSIAFKRCTECGGTDEKVKTAQCEVHKKELNDIPFRTIVADEAQNMINPMAKMTRATWAVMHQESVRYRFALSGTPGDNIEHMWSIMHGLVPDEYPTKGTYVKRYALQEFSYFKGGLEITGINPVTKEEFLGFFDTRFRRMPTGLVLKDLPPLINVTRLTEMTPKQKKAYKELEKKSMTRTDSGRLIMVTDSLVQQIRLMQYSSATCEVDDEGTVQLIDPSPKVDGVLEVLQDSTGPIVVAAESRKLIELCAKRLEKEKIEYGMIVGGMTEDQRLAVVNDLERGNIRALLFSNKAGGTGINMTAANVLVRMDRSWSMRTNLQVIGRVLRIGSEVHDSITVIDLVAPGTVEVRQTRTVNEKLRRYQEIARDKAAIMADVEHRASAVAELEALDNEEQDILNSKVECEVDDA